MFMDKIQEAPIPEPIAGGGGDRPKNLLFPRWQGPKFLLGKLFQIILARREIAWTANYAAQVL